jgi:hypothetical protein
MMLPGGLLHPALANGAQLVVVSGYTAGQPGGPVRVVLDQQGTRVLLVLASYEPVAWQLDVRPGTALAAVVVGAYREVAVAGQGAAPVFRLALPCAAAIGSAAYLDLMRVLQARLGRGRPDCFRGYVRLPEQVALTACRARGTAASMPSPASSISHGAGSGTSSCCSKPERMVHQACKAVSPSLRTESTMSWSNAWATGPGRRFSSAAGPPGKPDSELHAYSMPA